MGLHLALGGRPVLAGIELALAPGELVGLIGPNGAGKTTLLRVLAALQAPDAGTVRYDGQTAWQLGRDRLARGLAVLMQGDAVQWPLRADHLVALGRLPYRRFLGGMSAADEAAVTRALEAADAVHLRLRTVATLSAGERMRVLFARALAVEAPMLFADEPVAALDPFHQLQIMELLQARARAGAGVLVVLHDLALAGRFCDRLVLLQGGRVLADGAPDAVLTDDNLRRAYAVEVQRGQRDGVGYVLPWSRIAAPGP
ncbi:ABC transporter ATP-binding protein [Inquilinus sp.]|uniref:ABC transporter ATP-binding protein n=1 Tax=Inquilinus sp. TaxID=1932117 RepID=UPI0031DB6640